jgi:hypothetical protein
LRDTILLRTAVTNAQNWDPTTGKQFGLLVLSSGKDGLLLNFVLQPNEVRFVVTSNQSATSLPAKLKGTEEKITNAANPFAFSFPKLRGCAYGEQAERQDQSFWFTNLKNRLSLPPDVSSWYKKAKPRSSKVCAHSSHGISSKVSSPEYPGKLIRKTPALSSFSVPITLEGLPSLSSTHFLISLISVVVFEVLIIKGFLFHIKSNTSALNLFKPFFNQPSLI